MPPLDTAPIKCPGCGHKNDARTSDLISGGTSIVCGGCSRSITIQVTDNGQKELASAKEALDQFRKRLPRTIGPSRRR